MSLNDHGTHAWAPADGEILTVSDLVGRTRRMVESGFTDIWVEGEISNLRVPGSGHAYFTLIDDDAQLRAVCFRSSVRLLAGPLRQGDRMLFRGRLTLYEARGDLQMVVEHAEPLGAGLARLRFEQLKRKLDGEGLFATERKRPLPAMPHHIVVVTSPTGAAIRDILQVLERRAPWVDVTIAPAAVQGESAPTELVRAVAACSLPIISAVGHEVDVTLTDFAADARAATPSAGAELAVRDQSHWRTQLARLEESLANRLAAKIHEERRYLERLDPHRYDPSNRIEQRRIHVDRSLEAASTALDRRLWRLRSELSRHAASLDRKSPATRAAQFSARLGMLDEQLRNAVNQLVSAQKSKLTRLHESLDKLSPMGVLNRGYAVVRDKKGKLVRDAASQAEGNRVEVTLAQGELGCIVEKIFPGK
jgi:exodeoxyribonuclease VII large subunit